MYFLVGLIAPTVYILKTFNIKIRLILTKILKFKVNKSKKMNKYRTISKIKWSNNQTLCKIKTNSSRFI